MKKYKVFYVDPPWRYNFATENRKVENHYPTMEFKDILSLDVQSISEKDAKLYLWVTSPFLRKGLEVLEAWGFEYKSHIVWDKGSYGMGYWSRVQHEILLIGTRGNVKPPPSNLRTRSVLYEKKKKHSRKPDMFRQLIDQWNPGCSKVELFARETSNGWDVWGNEVETGLVLETPEEEVPVEAAGKNSKKVF